MRVEEFRAWLATRRFDGKPLTTVGLRVSKARRFEKAMAEFELDGDLDTQFDRDGMAAVTALLATLCKEARETGAGPTSLVGASTIASQRMDSLAATVRNYRQFRQDQAASKPPGQFEKGGEGDETSDEALLKRFDNHPVFSKRRNQWSDDATESFCRIARAIHDAGLDWWHTDIVPYQLRFGRKEQDAKRTSSVFGYVTEFGQITEKELFISINESAPRVGKEDWALLDTGYSKQIASAVRKRSDEIAQWKPQGDSGGPRPGLWPDEFGEEDEMVIDDARAGVGNGHAAAAPTSLILYGPPGTGKTYATTREAVLLCDGRLPDGGEAAIRARYDALRQSQIEFVTFHQSFGYEDFVEGLRPETGAGQEGGDTGFRLEPKAGVFRKIAGLASQAREAALAREHYDLSGRRVFKMSLGRAGSEDYIFDAAVAGDYVVLGWGGDVDWSDYTTYEAVHARWNADHPGTSGNDANIVQTSRFRVDMREGDLIVVSYGNRRFRAIAEVTGPYRFEPTQERAYNHRRPVRWLNVLEEPLPVELVYGRPFSQRSCYLLADRYLRRDALALLLPGGGTTDATMPRQFVLIIDEINRANISKVFGELITLLEPDKRLGAANEVRVRLPYSGDLFGVPANLHIIGTMNTADRSIALLDTALRRRFAFRELMPRPELLGTVDGIDLAALLTRINIGVEYLFDREHQIGHAYFMGCVTRADIDAVMRDRVIPLLVEYFFEDWGKVAAVLADASGAGQFLVRTELKPPPGLDDDHVRDMPYYRWVVRKDEFDYGALAAPSSGAPSSGAP